MTLGHPRAHRAVCDSTNRVARSLAERGAAHGTVVTADEQTAGRGRGGRSWAAPAGSSLLMSVVVRGPDELLSLRAGVALADVLSGHGLDPVAIKWPNDVWVDRRKVAGILVEGRPQEGWAVLGMGINVAASPPDLGDRATSIAEAGGTLTVPSLYAPLIEALDRRLAEAPPEALSAWRELDALTGTGIGWDGGAGTALGIDDRGRLIVDTPGGRVALDAGEVHLSR